MVQASTAGEHGIGKRRKYTKRIGIQMWESQLRKGGLMLAVLATLRHGRLYGPEIRRRLELIAGMTVSEGVIYPLLRRLRKTNLIQTEWIDPVDAKPRRYFALTGEGRRYLMELANTWNEFAGGMDRMLAMPDRRRTQCPDFALPDATLSVGFAEPLLEDVTSAG
jgi:PadR family transcriptional regulator, regulatory protein PadR